MILNKKNILIEDTIIKIIFSNCDLDLTKVDIEKLVKVADSHLITTLFYSKIVENGVIKAVITICPVSTNILVISATRLMFSTRSLFEKPRSLLMPNLVLSPSNTIE